jgi:hypothetical protein
LTDSIIQNNLQEIQTTNMKNFSADIRQPKIQSTTFPLSALSISLIVDDIDYQDMDRYVDAQIFPQLRDLRLKKRLTASSIDLVEQLKFSASDMTTFADWKALLKSYLQQKYPTEHEKYEKTLHDLKIR